MSHVGNGLSPMPPKPILTVEAASKFYESVRTFRALNAHSRVAILSNSPPDQISTAMHQCQETMWELQRKPTCLANDDPIIKELYDHYTALQRELMSRLPVHEGPDTYRSIGPEDRVAGEGPNKYPSISPEDRLAGGGGSVYR